MTICGIIVNCQSKLLPAFHSPTSQSSHILAITVYRLQRVQPHHSFSSIILTQASYRMQHYVASVMAMCRSIKRCFGIH
uniref:Secreted protein n=1 Tax=Panagrellus redivivus TaxID=6233 RepID=A0A7E4W0I7_PANRE